MSSVPFNKSKTLIKRKRHGLFIEEILEIQCYLWRIPIFKGFVDSVQFIFFGIFRCYVKSANRNCQIRRHFTATLSVQLKDFVNINLNNLSYFCESGCVSAFRLQHI